MSTLQQVFGLRLFCAAATLFILAGSASALSWSKEFFPNPIGPGSVTTLTFTIDNDSAVGQREIAFTDMLPAGVVIATPANVVSDCEGTVTAPDGGTTISLVDGRVGAFSSCTVSVNVTSSVIGVHTNFTSDLTWDGGVQDPVSAVLSVVEELPGFTKSFQPSVVQLGARSTLTFTIDNSANEGSRQQISFTDALPVGMVVADPANVASDCPAVTITAVPGSNIISVVPDFTVFPVPQLDSFSTCTISVDVIGTAAGTHGNITGELTTTTAVGPNPVSSGRASALLTVTSSPLTFTKSFVNDPLAPGEVAIVEFSITNNDRDNTATGIAFTDDLGAMVAGATALDLPENDVCGTGSQLTGLTLIRLSDGRLGPGETCTFTARVNIPASTPPGSYPNTTSAITGTVAGQAVSGAAATDTLFVSPAPILIKRFLDDPVIPGGTTRLQFMITNTSPTNEATGITFTDELPTVLIDAVDFPASGACGDGSVLTVTPLVDPQQQQTIPTRITLTDGNLGPGESCIFEVILQVAEGASSGIFTNTTEPISAVIADDTVTGRPASADLSILAGPQLSKRFIGDPVRPGEKVVLEFELSLPAESPKDATDIAFTDNLDDVLPGLVALGLPQADVCGAGSLLRGTSVIDFRGGRLRPGESCTFSVTLGVPLEAPLGTFSNTTSPVSAMLSDFPTSSAPATDDLVVTDLLFSKRFLEDTVIPGETAIIEFTISNQGDSMVTDIIFSDNLDTMISGATVINLPAADPCGPGSSIIDAGNGFFVLTDGVLRPGEECVFEVDVQVPPNVPDGLYTNVTSELTALVEDTQLVLPPATAQFEVTSTWIEISKRFVPASAQPGETVDLEFTLTNLDPDRPVTGISFTDPIPAGLTSVGGTISNPCGSGSQISGTGTLTFTGGSLGPGATCTFSVPVQVSAAAQAGEYDNLTSDVAGFIDQLPVRGDAVIATLLVGELPPEAIRPGINAISRPGDGTTVLTLGTRPDVEYCIQWTEDLRLWTTIPVVIVGQGTPLDFVDSGPPLTPPIGAKRFYRLGEKTP